MYKKHEIELRAYSLAKHLLQKDYVTFWKYVDTNNFKNLPISDTVNGSTGYEEVANMWRSHYQNLFTTVISCKHTSFVLDNLNNVSVDCVLSSSTEVVKVSGYCQSGY